MESLCLFVCLSMWQDLSRQYLLNHWPICNQTWCGGASSWAGVSCRMIWILLSWSMSQWWLVWSKYECLYNVFWSNDSLEQGWLSNTWLLDFAWLDWLAFILSCSRTASMWHTGMGAVDCQQSCNEHFRCVNWQTPLKTPCLRACRICPPANS